MSRNPIWTAQDFIFYADDGVQGSATALGAQNANISSGLYQGDNFRLRVNFGDTNSATTNNVRSIKLQFNLNGGGWTEVGPSSSIKYATSSYVTDGTNDANQRLNSITGSTWNGTFEEFDSNNSTTSRTWADGFTEIEFCLNINTAVPGDVIQFRPVTSSTEVPTITNTAQLTVSAIPGSGAPATRTELAHVETTSAGFSAGFVHDSSVTLTASVTPADNCLLVVIGSCVPNNIGPSQMSISSSPSLTWTERLSIGGGAAYFGTKIWTAEVTTGVATDITVQYVTSSTFLNGVLNVQQFVGYDTTSPIGASGSSSNYDLWGSGTTWDNTHTCTLSGTIYDNSVLLSTFFGSWDNSVDVDDHSGATIDPSSGFSEIRNEGIEVNSSKTKIQIQDISGSAISSFDQRWYGNTEYGAIYTLGAVEIISDPSYTGPGGGGGNFEYSFGMLVA